MTSMWERGSQRRSMGAAVVAARLSSLRQSLVWSSEELLTRAGSPP
jgi:hypothetical protein